MVKPNIIYIARHGEAEWNNRGIFQGGLDSLLTQQGLQHAYALASTLANSEIKYVFSSNLGRAKQTAEIIARTIGAELIIIPEFNEMRFGIFEGKHVIDVKRIFSDFFDARETNKYCKLYTPYPEGESYFDVYIRLLKPLTHILAHYDNFAIVGHESVNRVMRGIMKQIPLEEMVSVRQKHNELVTIDVIHETEKIIKV
jgi:probable phosphoglycerate mutase